MSSENTPTPMKPGIYPDMTAEEYFATDAVSQSFLWKLYKRTPAHAFYGERKETNAFDMGHAIHTAILEPDSLEARILRGPDDRRGNKWKDAQAEAEAAGALLLTSGDYDKALAVRDALHRNAWINKLVTGGEAQVEQSAFWHDAESDTTCRARLDLYRPDLGVALDLKSAASAAAWEFQGSVAKYGYHLQEAHYREGWERAGGGAVEGFVFLVLEKEPPYAHAVYELEPAAVEEGHLIRRKALQKYAMCRDTGIWPGYDAGVQRLDLPRWAYSEIAAQAEAAE